CARQQSNFDYW
nr:immunoglobulin heavy chain junction region [Macaca mulatta]MOY27961.1 immunoglobulin heavy chain junction region [Macaca mulatta]MOY28676.1 immunoglobulin heavy chain junction region [Macaca mulatta]